MDEPNEPTLYDLFDETTFRYWELQLQQGREPTPEQLARLMEVNPDHPVPPWLQPILIKALRGELKGRLGRPPRNADQQTRLWLAKADYHWRLQELRQAETAERAQASPTRAAKGRLHTPAHERVAGDVIQRWGLSIGVRAFLNEIGSRK
ncbi:hypothetical protein [Bradyrhizobium sp. NC92]|uniref:hypothetical protein n=1 Tax=Bradyrhizobium sp. (strain NC92) TaxID=55395 RepID=UPI0021A9F072|nr:hypothetical protein [Bradyrhizobium sp. NC92]UWU67593.1 hypothetical protein N2602_30780 [Bradyrhizobium sp. NC92]